MYGSRYHILNLHKIRNAQMFASGHSEVLSSQFCFTGWVAAQLACAVCQFPKPFFSPRSTNVPEGEQKEKTDNREYQHLPFSNLEKATDLRLHW